MKIVLGVSASVAIYKAADLARLLSHEGAEVSTVMSARAREFVSPALFDAVTGRPTLSDLFTAGVIHAHLEIARGADAFAVVPATADVVAKLAHGIADDALTTIALAVKCPRLIAPAMNPAMWAKAEVQRNVATLREWDYTVVEPVSGVTACGDEGVGHLAEVASIAEDILRVATKQNVFSGKTVVVTAGATRERWDTARLLTNPSSGLMGYEVARRAARRGARVKLITASQFDVVPLADAVQIVRVATAAEMYEATSAAFEDADVLIMAAAVADYRFEKMLPHKFKKTKDKTEVTLIPTVDILSELAGRKGDRCVVAFAAETDNMVKNARAKLLNKKADIIVANVIGKEGVGFSEVDAEAALITEERVIELGTLSKAELATALLDEVAQVLAKGN